MQRTLSSSTDKSINLIEISMNGQEFRAQEARGKPMPGRRRCDEGNHRELRKIESLVRALFR